jgi:hypothetical protein
MTTTLERSPMSTVTLRDALDDLEQRLAGARAPTSGSARSGGWLRADEEEEDDLFGEDDLGFDEIDEDDEDELGEIDEEDLDEDDEDLEEDDEP